MNVRKNKILKTALFAGELMLKNGAETYRSEETIEFICRSKGVEDINSIVTPTGIYISDNSLEGISLIRRVHNRTINLEKISQVNNFSRMFVNDEIDIDEAMGRLKEIDGGLKYNKHFRCLATGMSSGFITLLLGGKIVDFALATIISMIAMSIYWKIEKLSRTSFLANTIGGFIISVLSILCMYIGIVNDVDTIIVGSIMPLVPGVAMTNGLRDFISGDLIAGSSKVAEAILIAVSIAVGVGTVLKIASYLGGGL